MDRWILWQIEYKNNKPTKVPKNAITLNNASSTGAGTWTTYVKAKEQHTKFNNKYGIGFVLDGTGIVAVDIDNCIKNNELTSSAKDIIKKINSYAELSPSNHGVRIFCKATLDFNTRKKGNYEIFNSKKYATVTGNRIKDTLSNIENRQKEIEWYINKYIDVPEQPLKPTTPTEVIELASKSLTGQKFKDLFDGSNIGYPSSSEGDSAFLYMLAFWTDRNPILMDSIYRTSGRMREKWDRRQSGTTWGQLEIRKAIANVRETYEPVERKDFDFNKYKSATKYKEVKIDITKASDDEIIEILSKAKSLASVEPMDNSKLEFILSGVDSFDKEVGGFCLGECSVWTGVNGSGKSTILSQMILQSINQGYKSLVYSGELQDHKFQNWINLQAAGSKHIETKTSAQGKDFFVVKKFARERIMKWYAEKLFVYDNSNGFNYRDIIKVFEAYAHKLGFKVFLLDNFAKLDISDLDKDYYRAQGKLIDELCQFAQSYNVAVHCVSHPRKVHDRLIEKSDISGTGDITNRADNVFAIHRLNTQNKEYLKSMFKIQSTIIESSNNAIEIQKNRMFGTSDYFCFLKFNERSKRLVDARNPNEVLYGWDAEQKQMEMDNKSEYPNWVLSAENQLLGG